MISVVDEHHLRVGDQTWFGEFHSESSPLPDLIYERRQFIVRFESKWSVSVIWGSMTYSDNYDHGLGRGPHEPLIETPMTVEAAVLHRDRGELQGNGGEPYSRLTAGELNALLYHVSALHTTDHFNTDRTS